jgi:hypothetical protein
MSFRMRLLALLVTCAAFAAAGCKADREKCEQATRNYATLTFWAQAEPLIAKAPPDKRAALRKEKLACFTYELENKVDVVVTQCMSANNDEQIDCMIAAKTADQALACAELVEREHVDDCLKDIAPSTKPAKPTASR